MLNGTMAQNRSNVIPHLAFRSLRGRVDVRATKV